MGAHLRQQVMTTTMWQQVGLLKNALSCKQEQDAI